jgi:hypothetical protein
VSCIGAGEVEAILKGWGAVGVGASVWAAGAGGRTTAIVVTAVGARGDGAAGVIERDTGTAASPFGAASTAGAGPGTATGASTIAVAGAAESAFADRLGGAAAAAFGVEA